MFSSFTRRATQPLLRQFSTLPKQNFGNSKLLTIAGLGALSIGAAFELSSFIPLIQADQAGNYLDPSTATPFPTTLISPTGAILKLQGTGVRTVSFLSIKVYAVGFYCDERTLANKVLSGYSEDRLLVQKNKVEGGPIRGEALIGEMIDLPHDAAVVIIPQRSTSLPHLRDGFARALVARLKQPHVSKTLSEEESEQTSESIIELKSYFANRPLAKGAPLFVYLNGLDRSLQFSLLDATDSTKYEILGTLKNAVLAKQLFLSYFSDSGASSPELLASTAKGLAGEPRV